MTIHYVYLVSCTLSNAHYNPWPTTSKVGRLSCNWKTISGQPLQAFQGTLEHIGSKPAMLPFVICRNVWWLRLLRQWNTNILTLRRTWVNMDVLCAIIFHNISNIIFRYRYIRNVGIQCRMADGLWEIPFMSANQIICFNLLLTN